MAQAHAASDVPAAAPSGVPLTDWTLRPFASGLPPLVVGLGYALAMAGLSWLVRLGIEGWSDDFLFGAYFWLDVLNGVVFGYAATASWLLRQGRLRDLAALRPVLRADAAGFERLARRTVCVAPRRLAIGGLLGAVCLGSLPAADPRFWEGPAPPLSDPTMLFFIARMAAMGVLVGHALWTEARATVAFRQIGAESVEVDLLDVSGLAPFARAGLRSAFAWVLASSLVSLFWLGPAAGTANTAIVFGILALVSVGFYFTLEGVHRSLRAAKQAALGEVTARIRRAALEVRSGAPQGDAPALGDLIAYHGLIERASEWPLGAPALLRVALIGALGVGSWLGGALVERLVERFL